jgi:uncharacterized protein (DUF1778 family)
LGVRYWLLLREEHLNRRRFERITARESQIEKIDALAEAAGMTRSGYMVRAAIGEEKRAVRARSRGTRVR